MADRQDPTSEAFRRLHLASDIGTMQLELTIEPEPPAAARSLPMAYGVDSFELLVVDPEYAYLCWELTPTLLATAASVMGEPAYNDRILQIRFFAAGEPQSHALAGYNLYGEHGRWFIQTGQSGQDVYAVLGFASGALFHELLRRGPVSFPRSLPMDADEYEELQVEYERGPHGQLVLVGLGQPQAHSWPASLPVAARPPLGLSQLAADGTGQLLNSGWPASGIGSWPSSPGVTSGAGVRRGLSLEQEEAQ